MLKAGHTYKQLSDQRKKPQRYFGVQDPQSHMNKELFMLKEQDVCQQYLTGSLHIFLQLGSCEADLFLQICPQETARHISLRAEPAFTLPWEWVSNFFPE